MDKRFFAIIVVIIAIFVGAAIITNNKKSDDSSNVSASEHFRGGDNAKVTLTEYGDFQCPACERYSSVINKVLDHYGDKIKFQFRNYPIVSLHPNSYAASRAAEAAGLQGKYWQMHDALYDLTNWTSWTQAQNPQTFFDSYAKNLDLDLKKFKSDSKADITNKIVKADMAAGKKLDIQATPTFLINGEKQGNIGLSLESFQAVIDPELAKVGQADPSAKADTKPADKPAAKPETTPVPKP